MSHLRREKIPTVVVIRSVVTSIRVERTTRYFQKAAITGMIASAATSGCAVKAATVASTPMPMRQVMNQPAFSHCDGHPVQIGDSSERGASLGESVTASVIHHPREFDLLQHGTVHRHGPQRINNRPSERKDDELRIADRDLPQKALSA